MTERKDCQDCPELNAETYGARRDPCGNWKDCSMEGTYSDPAMVRSNFERRPKDGYFTQSWVTRALLSALESERLLRRVTTVWEPACGRGDMVRSLREDGHLSVIPSDIDLSSFREGMGIQKDFLQATRLPGELRELPREQRAIITNPPYHRVPGTRNYMTDLFVRQALGMDVDLVAMLMRTTWKCGSRRRSFFEQNHLGMGFHMEVVLVDRPRWDDWENVPKPDKTPRHDYSWFVWARGSDRPTMLWRGKD